MLKIGYLRVSTNEQRPDRQIDALEAICDEMHVERVSAVSAKRPVYERVLKKLRPNDTLVVLDLDRAFRSVVDAVTEVEKLRTRGVQFQIVNLQVDTSTPAGHLVFVVLSAFAEFERRTLIQRTREGLAAARKRGQRLGRPPKFSAAQISHIRHRHEVQGHTLAMIAADYDVTPLTVWRTLKRCQATH